MTASSEIFCQNWNDFQKNISLTFQEMRDHLDLADVTLACEDNKQFKAQKFVLSTILGRTGGGQHGLHPVCVLLTLKLLLLEVEEGVGTDCLGRADLVLAALKTTGLSPDKLFRQS